MSSSPLAFGPLTLGTDERPGLRLYCCMLFIYCCLFVIFFLGCATMGRAYVVTPGGAANPNTAAAEASSSLSDAPTSFIAAASTSAGNVVTYHYDKRRTGWNSNETMLTTGPNGTVKPGAFGVLQAVKLGVATGDT
ncbi:MAG: hypothetical protein JWN43_1161, partial [Gammaproteobacteria bacterium]|nr:hypothetical protein [Gammaproteobacteria bacterium]